MLGSYIKTAIRHILRHKLYSFINIGGLAVGLAACILILLFVRDEISYDSWLPNIEQVHRMEATYYPPGRPPIAVVNTPGPARDVLTTYFEGRIEEVARIYRSRHSLSTADRSFNQAINYVDDNFFELFDLPMVAGLREAAVRDSTSLILSEAMAQKFFGNEPAVGETISFDDEIDYQVVGVFKDIPSNSHLVLNFIAYFDLNRYTDRPSVAQQWTSANVQTYIKTAPGVSVDEINAAAKDFVDASVTIQIPGLSEFPPSDIVAFDFILLELGTVSLLFALYFRYLPDIRLKWRDIWPGATVTAGLLIMGKSLIAFFISNSTVPDLYDAAGSILVMMLWVYYSSAILLLGATFTFTRAEALNSGHGVAG